MTEETPDLPVKKNVFLRVGGVLMLVVIFAGITWPGWAPYVMPGRLDKEPQKSLVENNQQRLVTLVETLHQSMVAIDRRMDTLEKRLGQIADVSHAKPRETLQGQPTALAVYAEDMAHLRRSLGHLSQKMTLMTAWSMARHSQGPETQQQGKKILLKAFPQWSQSLEPSSSQEKTTKIYSWFKGLVQVHALDHDRKKTPDFDTFFWSYLLNKKEATL